MPLDKYTMKIEAEDPQGRGTFIAECECSHAELSMYSGPLTRITITNPVGPDTEFIISTDRFVNDLLLNFAKAFWDVQEIKVQ